MTLSDASRDILLRVSTATLTTILFKRGFRNVFLQGLKPLNPSACRFVGPAFTLRYIPAREDLDAITAFEDPRHPQRVAIEECPAGHVLVMDSRGDASAASSGNLLITRLWHRGGAGVVTDGGFRDSPEIAAMNFPAWHTRPSAPTNLIRHHAVDLQLPIACAGVSIYPGDIMVADAEGIVCIPRHLAEEVASEAVQQTMYEDWVNQKILAGAGLPGLYPLLDPALQQEYAQWQAQESHRYA
ncbi:ribonuclease activity regulator RraA [Cupriavidus alkaliphilus]|uniref:ribonuclease activity regulator RraA n=1 Tax=Cupriavidus alkaliphilus TaxID=942866 RepID=UPI0016092A6E|nr:ribonuclease activity regulator RraA [Cupriavidus alkaliphilus]MBB3014366.1 regulator of RNase E activity RraA [Cupriavidus alkaliphilus]